MTLGKASRGQSPERDCTREMDHAALYRDTGGSRGLLNNDEREGLESSADHTERDMTGKAVRAYMGLGTAHGSHPACSAVMKPTHLPG